MKKIFLLVCLSISLAALSQSFTFTPTDNYEASIDLNTYTVHQINIINQTGGELLLGWGSFDVDMPEEWTITVCDFGSCNIGIPDSGLMYPIFDTLTGFLKLSVNANNYIGSGTVSFTVYDSENPEQFGIISFTIHAESLIRIHSYELSKDIKVYPNPANDYINIAGLKGDENYVFLLNSNNQVVKKIKVQEKINTVDLKGMNKGMYVLMFTDDYDIMYQKKVLIQ